MPRMRRHQKVAVVLMAFLIISGSALLWLTTPKSLPLKLSLVRVRTEGTNLPEAIIHFTNESTSKLRWDLQTFVSSNGVWLKAQRQPQIDYASAVLASHGARNHAVPVPGEAMRWKVELRCQRRDTPLEDKVEDVFKTFGVRSPFGSDSRRPILTNELVFER